MRDNEAERSAGTGTASWMEVVRGWVEGGPGVLRHAAAARMRGCSTHVAALPPAACHASCTAALPPAASRNAHRLQQTPDVRTCSFLAIRNCCSCSSLTAERSVATCGHSGDSRVNASGRALPGVHIWPAPDAAPVLA